VWQDSVLLKRKNLICLLSESFEFSSTRDHTWRTSWWITCFNCCDSLCIYISK
jgi:hypothetical protein